MIVVDSSALISIVLKEPTGHACIEVLETAERLLISAAILAEVSVVAGHRGFLGDLQTLIDRLDIEIVPADEHVAEMVTAAYMAWGKGRHKASLNLMDCFSYVTAKAYECPLLFVGNDFSQTDVVSAL
ncbi:type II toxin-antitoxin system VapC family toxin [Asticcacaulis sp. SL142]|uniref:type II toxin-antitoxin system VapC family toxin n=1 Tax=Asticcacaulis sp. SL142 TaxID=2995155 RepID=UPI00226CEF48|nr:type II toxin-antitoxin system VapC family toxin [Asticcacaulis sp. SL142]WAC48190.1 type II toxin-antitoxin system VapC family toxin [Asticcacaulis sp. SL142]